MICLHNGNDISDNIVQNSVKNSNKTWNKIFWLPPLWKKAQLGEEWSEQTGLDRISDPFYLDIRCELCDDTIDIDYLKAAFKIQLDVEIWAPVYNISEHKWPYNIIRS